jgi:hypothetical protein
MLWSTWILLVCLKLIKSQFVSNMLEIDAVIIGRIKVIANALFIELFYSKLDFLLSRGIFKYLNYFKFDQVVSVAFISNVSESTSLVNIPFPIS